MFSPNLSGRLRWITFLFLLALCPRKAIEWRRIKNSFETYNKDCKNQEI